jgi:predicted ATPase
MFTKLRLQNFRSWRDTGAIRLAPITVFFGVNSAGKTSLLQFLLMLKQTSESPDRHRVLHTGDEYSLVGLGTFRDMIFAHDLSRKLEFELSWQLPQDFSFHDPLRTRRRYQGNAIDVSASIAARGQTTAEEDVPYVERMEYNLRNNDECAVTVRLIRHPASKTQQYDLEAEPYKLAKSHGRFWPLPAPTRFYGFPDEVPTRYQNAGFTNELALALEKQLKRVFHLGPLRQVPKRTYTWAGDTPEHVGQDEDATLAALMAAASRKISTGSNKWASPFQKTIARWLTQLGLLESFTARKIAPKRNEYEVRVRTGGSNQEVDLPDVGFGISQVLPVVVEAFYVAQDSTVVIEQPELHLHPRVESELADMFIEAVHSREDGRDRHVQFLIESHSEHVLQRLQRRIAEGKLHPREVALYFCEPSAEGSTARGLQVDMFGEIANWPADFFGDPMTDLSAKPPRRSTACTSTIPLPGTGALADVALAAPPAITGAGLPYIFDTLADC